VKPAIEKKGMEKGGEKYRDKDVPAEQGRMERLRASAGWTQIGCLHWIQLKPRGERENRKMEEIQ
jgi:hypothetical protein